MQSEETPPTPTDLPSKGAEWTTGSEAAESSVKDRLDNPCVLK